MLGLTCTLQRNSGLLWLACQKHFINPSTWPTKHANSRGQPSSHHTYEPRKAGSARMRSLRMKEHVSRCANSGQGSSPPKKTTTSTKTRAKCCAERPALPNSKRRLQCKAKALHARFCRFCQSSKVHSKLGFWQAQRLLVTKQE